MVKCFVPGYNMDYSVDLDGNVYSYKYGKEKKMNSPIYKSGYLYVNLYKNGKAKKVKNHQLVMMSFKGHVRCGMQKIIDHIDGNKLNNNLFNLQITDVRTNVIKSTKRGSSKYVGVHWCNTRKKWGASIGVNRKKKNLGFYDDEIEAKKAYDDFHKTVVFNYQDLHNLKEGQEVTIEYKDIS